MKCESVVTLPGQSIGYIAEETPDPAALEELGTDIGVFGAIDRLRVRLGREAPVRLVFADTRELTTVARFVLDRVPPSARDQSRTIQYVREFFGAAELVVTLADADMERAPRIGPESAPQKPENYPPAYLCLVAPSPSLCPLRVQSSLEAYVRGLPPGDFIRAVLSNDLSEAIARADDVNIHALPHIVAYVREHLPAVAWGSSEKVNRWLSKASDSTRSANAIAEARDRKPDAWKFDLGEPWNPQHAPYGRAIREAGDDETEREG